MRFWDPTLGGGDIMKEVTCQCGWQARGTEAEVIAQVMEHGRTAHGQELTAEGQVVGQFEATGVRPLFVERLNVAGVELPPQMFDGI